MSVSMVIMQKRDGSALMKLQGLVIKQQINRQASLGSFLLQRLHKNAVFVVLFDRFYHAGCHQMKTRSGNTVGAVWLHNVSV